VCDEESGQLHREIKGFASFGVTALATFLSPDGQQMRLAVGSSNGQLWVYEPEAGSMLHHFRAHSERVIGLACIASSSAAPHHPRLVSASYDRTAKVWDAETGGLLAVLRGHQDVLLSVVVWKEHVGEDEHDRIATAGLDGHVRVWDGEAFTPMHDLESGTSQHMLPFKSAEGPARLLVGLLDGAQVWDPEEGRLLHDGINRGCPLFGCHLFESAQGRHLLAITGHGTYHPRHPGGRFRVFLDVWDLGEAPAATGHLRGAHKQS
jgi:WD40 repeat protein